jgi:hypothetical protein
MLDVWEQQSSENKEPAGESWEEWKANIEAEVRALRAELDAVKSQENNGLLVNHKIEIVELKEPEPVLPLKVYEPSEFDIQIKEEPERVGLLINQSIESDIQAFEVAYNKLEHDQHTAIWKLRDALAWSDERFDTVLCRLRDESRYQLQAGDTEHMTKKQIKAGFTDENDFRFLTVMKLPQSEKFRPLVDDTDVGVTDVAPMDATVAETTLETPAPVTSRQRGRPRKEREAITKSEAETTTEAPAAPIKRKPGRPRKERPTEETAAVLEEESAASPQRKPGRPRRGSV